MLMELDENSSVLDKESISVEFVRFEYDIEKAAQAVEESLSNFRKKSCFWAISR